MAVSRTPAAAGRMQLTVLVGAVCSPTSNVTRSRLYAAAASDPLASAGEEQSLNTSEEDIVGGEGESMHFLCTAEEK
ncbi:hypothetical protein CgunFtcFv8_016910 [Champsocephalus gunnari]|uniref:Uncharacterized protein n=1 Tax=Champsocephalus gunnari TaxID=52237 RepID=A0AAN8CRI3_CHAGU|nr:hypothetical protein CgunFtcFv8_016910 [Champsocephalus gunnari]